MTPIDDSLREALTRAAAAAPDASHIDGELISRRAGRMRQRRASVALLASAVVVAGIATGATMLTGTHRARTTVPTSEVSATPEATPSPCVVLPINGRCTVESSSVASWTFRGDSSTWDKNANAARDAYTTYRAKTQDPLEPSGPVSYVPIYAAPTANQAGDVVCVLVKQPGRMHRVFTVVLTPAGTQVVADQPVDNETVLIDALLPSDPANLILALAKPGEDKIMYYLDGKTTEQATVDGVAEFGRALESKGGTYDEIGLKNLTGATSPILGTVQPMTYSRVPGAFRTDPSQPGRMASAAGAANWVLSAWRNGDQKSMAEHADREGLAAIATLDPTKTFGDANGCPNPEGQERLQYSCLIHTSETEGIAFTVLGSPSLGYSVHAVGMWIA